MPIGSFPARRTGAPKASEAAPDAKGKPAAEAGGRARAGQKPGAEAPEHLRDAQPEASQKMSLGDKLSAAANLAGAGASIYPLLQSHKQDKGAGQPNNPPSDDMADFYKAKMSVAVGPPPINW